MREFPTLYKRTKTGKIQEWSIRVEGDVHGMTRDGYSNIITVQGHIDGKKQIYTEKISSGKNIGKANETMPYEQAVSEAQSSWNKKKDEGYKSLEDLGFDGTSQYLDSNPTQVQIDSHMRLDLFLDKYLPKNNTDANGRRKPMLAKSEAWQAKDKRVTFPCWIQPKLNGVRCLSFFEDGKVIFLSREGKEYNIPHLVDELKPVFEDNPYLILDGEIYHHGSPLNRIISWVKDLQIESSLLEYHIYDIAIDDTTWDNRLKILASMFDSSYIFNKVVKVPTYPCRNDEYIENYHTNIKSLGYEGAMLRISSALYGFGTRSNFLIKVKSFKEKEFKVIGGELGKRGTEDMVFVLVTSENKSFKAKPIGTREEKEKYWSNLSNIINKKATVKYFEETEYGIPFHPSLVAIRDYE